jgi:hypothetical protein
MDDTYDVVAVDIKANTVRLIAKNETHGEADAIMKMAVARRGVDEEFFSVVRHGHYNKGDEWKGDGDVPSYKPETSEDGRIQRIGNMWYPVGPRGLE